ncbi:MAG TPA: hypothetical protein QGF58_28385 [Myxococcota bacterium]|nr:hypothetical protein [Myxococcota bacterium]
MLQVFFALAGAQETDRLPGVLAVVEAGSTTVECTTAGGEARIELVTDGQREVLVQRGDRPALSPDGTELVWVAGPVASVWWMSLSERDPVQLTNVGLTGPSPDFVPPPHRGGLVFDGDVISWDSPEGPKSVAAP